MHVSGDSAVLLCGRMSELPGACLEQVAMFLGTMQLPSDGADPPPHNLGLDNPLQTSRTALLGWHSTVAPRYRLALEKALQENCTPLNSEP